MAPQSVKSVIKRFKSALESAHFPDAKLYLFGSYARGDARPDSDIDICLVSRVFETQKEEYEKEAIVIAFGIDSRIQVVVTDPYKFRKDPLSPLYSRIRKEAIAA